MRFIVTAEGINGTTFVYETEGPADASDMEVKIEVYRVHGQALREGLQIEPLGVNSRVERFLPDAFRDTRPLPSG